MYKKLSKPVLDFLVAILTFVALFPLFSMIVVALAIAFKGSPLFLQKRPGKNDRIFTIIKFRTMSNEKDAQGNLLPDHMRLSGFGKLVRSTSLDELPQLLNIIKGDMSFVGPRPLLPEYLALYNKEQLRRHSVKPGITGWAQVNGRNLMGWDEKFKFDVWYVNHQSFFLDLKIIIKTIKKVFISEGINATGATTTNAFKGSHHE